jgi:peptide/nickel transport system permease protein
MIRYIARRLLISVPTLLGVSIALFALANSMPGDAVLAMISSDAPLAEELIKIRQGQLGLDQPLPVQYMRWVGQLAQGNLGFSYINGRPIGELIVERVPATVQLMGVSLLISLLIGMALGMIAAVKKYSLLDYLLTVAGFAGLSVPVFFLGMVLVYVFALRLGWFPTSGMGTIGEAYSLRANLLHLVLPALTLSLVRIPMFMRYTRASMLSVLGDDYVRTARAKGLLERTVLLRHVLRNALIPVITVVGVTLPVLFGGAIIVETIFQWPGIGLLYISAVSQRDIPLLMGIALVSAVLVLASNLLADVAYAVVDPRIQYT